MTEVPFTAAQLEAVDVAQRHLDACVVAGPGSGKTTVLVEYFRRLVAEGVDPLRILAITFTEKAAANMRKKLAEAFQEQAALRARLERSWVSTVHGFCGRLLRENAVLAGVDPEFQVADVREAVRLQNEAIQAAIDELFTEKPAIIRRLIRGLSSWEFEDALLSAYDAMRGAGISVDQLAGYAVPAGTTVAHIENTLRALAAEPVTQWSPAQKLQLQTALEGAERIISAASAGDGLRAIEAFSCNLRKCKQGNQAYVLLKQLKEQIEDLQYTLITDYYACERSLLLDVLRRFDRLYRERKQQSGVLDFSDLEEYAVRLLEEQEETRERVAGQFDHILMDEFQDTNGQQARLLRLVRRPDRFYAVGDINQSIFGFRHAEPRGFHEYREDVERRGRRVIHLTDNFRSRPEILAAVETVLHGKTGIEPRPLVAGRKFETPKPYSVEVLYAADEEQEAQWIARRVLELVGPGLHFRDLAVLVRNTDVFGPLTDAFERAGIPYLVNSGRGFYQTREVSDLSHLLRVIANPRDELSLAAVLRSPLVGASDEALLALRTMGENLGASLVRLADDDARRFDPEDFGILRRFTARLHRWRIRRESVTFDRLLADALDECGYRPASGARGEANIAKFLAQARSAAQRQSLDEFLAELDQMRADNPREQDSPPEDAADMVKVMTVHSAKGLEFPVVFVAGIHKGVDTSVPVIAFSPAYGLGGRWRNPVKREDKSDRFLRAIREERDAREEAESQRLLYVAMTRAEDHLVLSFSGPRIQNWARLLAEALALDLRAPCDEIVPRSALDGKQWNLRLLVTDRTPEALPCPVVEGGQRELQWVGRPPAPEQHDSNTTVTALAQFAICPRRYYLGGYLGFEGRLRRSAPDGELSASELGTQVHELLAGRIVSEPDPEAVRLAEVFRQSPLARRAAHASRIEREFDFLVAVEGIVIRGQIDLWFEESGERIIVDYKTDAVSRQEAHQRVQDYALQLKLYALAIERVTGRLPNRAYLHFLRPNVLVEVDVCPSLLDSPEQVVREFQEAQAALDFPLREGAHCVRCPFYKDLCPAGR
jgi:ATP-dependent helicase/nuclease subunit A